MENATVDEVYELICDTEKLRAYSGMGTLVKWAENTTFRDELPFDEIKAFIAEERASIFKDIPEEIANTLQWEHIGSTSIKGMPGTLNPDSLVMVKSFPPPRELIAGLINSGLTFFGAGPLSTEDLWFLKKIKREGSPLNDNLYKIHVNIVGHGPAMMLIETRDRCSTEEWAFNDYKNSKVEAAKKLKEGDTMGYKRAKGSSLLLKELGEKYNIAHK